MNRDTAEWVSWATRPDGGTTFRQSKAHARAGDSLTVCGTRIPTHSTGGFARVSVGGFAESLQVDRCARCERICGPDPQEVRVAVLRASQWALEPHRAVRCALAAYSRDGDPGHLLGTVFLRVRDHNMRGRG